MLRADSFSDPTGYPRLSVVPDDEYYTRRGIGIEDVIEVPASLDAFFERFNSADPKTREKLLRASYWLDAAYRVWDISKSLSYVAAINAVEVLAPDREPPDPCPCCHQDRNPGPTAQFRTTVETYAAAEGAVARARMYNLRSTLVHGRGLHSLDVPRTWGALEPATEEHRPF